MNPDLPQPQPGYRPAPFQARSDRDVLTPNQRIVFLAAYLFIGFGLLATAVVVGYLGWRSDFEAWLDNDSGFRGDSPSLVPRLVGSALFTTALGAPLLLILAVLEAKLRTYMLERPFRG
ncbi:hypothetical protein [Nocardia asteroides]|uniref:hypothetical protein n=1 Tax=Nocardia asteroides TaxID=1824 RepID=UPI001E2FBB56|nr:hypothetical protein [Nocardia asteroides]UGT60868.1 hypothetical protein LTT61_27575 [Nocardia asteroides]